VTWHGIAEERMNEFINMVQDGTRDLSSKTLEPYWGDPPYPSSEEVLERKAASDEFREQSDLPEIGQDTFVSQISPGGSQTLFMDFLDAMGIEKEYVEDISSEEVSPIPIPRSLLKPVNTLAAAGIEVDEDAVRERFGSSVPPEPDEVLHIDEPLPADYAEEDSIVAEKMRRAKVYVATYQEEGS